jgi:hypothetical protein
MRGDFHRTSDEQVPQMAAPEWCKVSSRCVKAGRNSASYTGFRSWHENCKFSPAAKSRKPAARNTFYK